MGIYSEKYIVKYSDIGKSNKLNLKSLTNYLQEVACAHSDLVGYGLNDEPKTHLAWLLLDWKIKMFSHSKHREEISINTWPKSFQKVYSYRDFEIVDSNNNVIGLASSKWLLINTETKKFEKVSTTMVNDFGVVDKNVFKDSLDERPKEPIKQKLNFVYEIQRRDIDTNGHVNNLHYIDYALETLPDKVYNSTEFDNIEIHYKKEIKYGEIINCYYSFESNKHIVTIKNKDNSVLHSIIKLY